LSLLSEWKIKVCGSFGVRDVGLMESAIFRPQASFDENDLYVTIFEKAAALLHSLLKNHPFIDGNKRTAFTSCGLFLQLNGYHLINRHKESVEFALRVEDQSLSFEEIVAWLAENTKKQI
jgi:death-on-curing protein